MEKITNNGGFSTKTDFKLDNGDRIRVEVWYVTEYTSANKGTYYNCNISTKGKGCSKWIHKLNGKTAKDESVLKVITEDQLYTAYYNHWAKCIFSNGSLNGELIDFTVKEKPQQSKLYDF